MGNKIGPILIQIEKLPEKQKQFILDFYKYKISGQYTENNVGTYLKILKNFAEENPGLDLANAERETILGFLDKRIKPLDDDPDQKWITTWNHYRDRLSTVYKWWLNKDSDVDEEDWKSPKMFAKIRKKKTKRQATYKPHEIWEEAELLVFVKYVPHMRDKLAFTLGYDLAGRNHEAVNLKVGDVKIDPNQNYAIATIPYQSKTGERTNPLIMSYPYLIEWSKQHPNWTASSPLLTDIGTRKKYSKQLSPSTLWGIYDRCHKRLNELMVKHPDQIDREDMPILQRVLEKPHNPYLVNRHSSITNKTDTLSDQQLKQYAGWTKNSQRILTYVSRSPKQIINPLLKAAGVRIEEEEKFSVTKICPSCNTPNRKESTFCSKCNLLLSTEKYLEMQEDRKQKEKADSLEKQAMILRLEKMEKMMMEMQQDKANSLLKPQEKE